MTFSKCQLQKRRLNNNGYTIERLLSKNPDDKFNDVMKMSYAKFARIFEGDIWSTKVETEEDFDKEVIEEGLNELYKKGALAKLIGNNLSFVTDNMTDFAKILLQKLQKIFKYVML